MLDDILNGKYPNYQSSKLLTRLIAEGYKEKKCERCGITEWMGEKISFHLHHKDGDHANNELTNLKVLCPNCHSQTNNYAGKRNKKLEDKSKTNQDKLSFYDDNKYKILCPICKKNIISKRSSMCGECWDKKRRIPKISKEDLFKIMETNTYTSASKILEVSRKTVSRWHKYYLNKKDVS